MAKKFLKTLFTSIKVHFSKKKHKHISIENDPDRQIEDRIKERKRHEKRVKQFTSELMMTRRVTSLGKDGVIRVEEEYENINQHNEKLKKEHKKLYGDRYKLKLTGE